MWIRATSIHGTMAVSQLSVYVAEGPPEVIGILLGKVGSGILDDSLWSVSLNAWLTIHYAILKTEMNILFLTYCPFVRFRRDHAWQAGPRQCVC